MTTPAGLRRRGRALWLAVTDALELDVHEGALLEEAARCADRLDQLDHEIKKSGLLLPDGRVVPAAVEARHQAITFARIIAALRLPTDLSELERPQRRAGARGVYAAQPLRAVGGER
jgi:hypothetical protein